MHVPVMTRALRPSSRAMMAAGIARAADDNCRKAMNLARAAFSVSHQHGQGVRQSKPPSSGVAKLSSDELDVAAAAESLF